MDNKTLIKETRKVLHDNKVEWETRYIEYAGRISCNLNNILRVRKTFHEWDTLKLYLSTTNAKTAKKKIRLDLRYLGQSIAQIKADTGDVKITTKDKLANNQKFFGCDILLNNVEWNSPEAAAFRKHFLDHPQAIRGAGKGNEEHRIESLLLTEFLKKEGKVFRNIKPVTIADIRFPMPTPLKASKKGIPGYAKQKGGGIDILARTGTGGKNTRLCIMELKDENKPSEPVNIVVQQAIKYAVFIRELLRSDAGEAWYKLFGFSSAIPEKLILNAVCVMPDAEGTDISFAGEEYDIDGDIIQLHYLFFEETSWNVIVPTRTSLYPKR